MTGWKVDLAHGLETLPQAQTDTGRAIISELLGDWSLDEDYAIVLTGRWLSNIRRNWQYALNGRTVESAWRLSAWDAFRDAAKAIRSDSWGGGQRYAAYALTCVARWHELNEAEQPNTREAS